MPVTSPRAGARFTRPAPEYGYEKQPAEWARLNARAANAALDGKLNSVGSVTLTANQLTTTLTDRRINPDSAVLLMPTTETAGGEVGIYIVCGDGTATINHGDHPGTLRTFRYVVLG